MTVGVKVVDSLNALILDERGLVKVATILVDAFPSTLNTTFVPAAYGSGIANVGTGPQFIPGSTGAFTLARSTSLLWVASVCGRTVGNQYVAVGLAYTGYALTGTERYGNITYDTSLITNPAKGYMTVTVFDTRVLPAGSYTAGIWTFGNGVDGVNLYDCELLLLALGT